MKFLTSFFLVLSFQSVFAANPILEAEYYDQQSRCNITANLLCKTFTCEQISTFDADDITKMAPLDYQDDEVILMHRQLEQFNNYKKELGAGIDPIQGAVMYCSSDSAGGGTDSITDEAPIMSGE